MSIKDQRLHRREALTKTAAVVAAFGLPIQQHVFAAEKRTTGMGLLAYCCAIRRGRTQGGGVLLEPMRFLEHCRSLGAGGMQTDLGVLDDEAADALRNRAAELGMYIEAIVKTPQDEGDVARFESQIRTAARVGALAARTTIIPGRRYEQFNDLATFREFAARGKRSLELARPVVEKQRVPLAVENHKDHRIDERVALLKEIGSEYIGACVDTGNNIALLDDPIETVEALAPWAFSVHLKDQAVAPYEDGFLLGDIPLGQGYLNLKQMVEVLRRAKPKVRFSLELITRDPLKVPCLSEKYWATFPKLPGADLARTLRDVKKSMTSRLGQISGLSTEALLAREDQNIAESIAYAVSELRI